MILHAWSGDPSRITRSKTKKSRSASCESRVFEEFTLVFSYTQPSLLRNHHFHAPELLGRGGHRCGGPPRLRDRAVRIEDGGDQDPIRLPSRDHRWRELDGEVDVIRGVLPGIGEDQIAPGRTIHAQQLKG